MQDFDKQDLKFLMMGLWAIENSFKKAIKIEEDNDDSNLFKATKEDLEQILKTKQKIQDLYEHIEEEGDLNNKSS